MLYSLKMRSAQGGPHERCGPKIDREKSIWYFPATTIWVLPFIQRYGKLRPGLYKNTVPVLPVPV